MIEIMINVKESFCPQKQLTHFTLFGLLTISHKKQTGTIVVPKFRTIV